MVEARYYRGGNNNLPQRSEVRIDKQTGLVKPSRGLSVYNRADHPNLARFGGAFEVVFLPQGLSVLQIGEDPSHHEIAPAHHMAWDDYLDLMHQILLVPV